MANHIQSNVAAKFQPNRCLLILSSAILGHVICTNPHPCLSQPAKSCSDNRLAVLSDYYLDAVAASAAFAVSELERQNLTTTKPGSQATRQGLTHLQEADEQADMEYLQQVHGSSMQHETSTGGGGKQQTGLERQSLSFATVGRK